MAAVSNIQVHIRGESSLPLHEGAPNFTETLKNYGRRIRRGKVRVLQINIGRKCDLACTHCHVEAGPKRTENMDEKTAARAAELIRRSPDVETVDFTGGAPELNPHFRHLASVARECGKEVLDRCNLTVLFEKGQEDTAQFLADNGVTIIASLPCYTSENVEKQRGKGVFGKSERALKMLNKLGYAKDGSPLKLHLVYNPVGAYLPGAQAQLQADYKTRLREDLGVEFNDLYTITNMPIKRFLHFLRNEGKEREYMQLLIDNFNPAAAAGVMCVDMVSVSWDGYLYDCDFNQMMDIPLAWKRRSLWDIENFNDVPEAIALDNHCYGCTAGAGSSCGGALVE